MVRLCNGWAKPWVPDGLASSPASQRVFACCPSPEDKEASGPESGSVSAEVKHSSSCTSEQSLPQLSDPTSDELGGPKRKRSLFDCIERDTHGNSQESTSEVSLSAEVFESNENNADDKACMVCNRTDDDESMLLCDRCDDGYHIWCTRPILVAVPRGQWFCEKCREPPRVKGT